MIDSSSAVLTYCSFAEPGKFLGAVVLEGILEPRTAAQQCHNLGVNPGGGLAMAYITPDMSAFEPLSKLTKRLLSREDLQKVVGSNGEKLFTLCSAL